MSGRPDLTDEMAEPPEDLPEDAKRFWRVEICRLSEVGLLDRVDHLALEGLATMYARACQASRVVAFEGHFAKGSTGADSRAPGHEDRARVVAMFLRFAEHFALTPVARTRLGLAELEFRRNLEAELHQQLGPPDLTPVG